MATTYPLLGQIVRQCPDVEAATHLQSWEDPWLGYRGRAFQEATDFVDTSFFDVFRYTLEYGGAQTALKDKYSVVFSNSTAKKIFGDVDPVGKTVIMNDSIPLKVTGVLASLPSNCTVRPTMLLPTALLEDLPGFRQTAGWYNEFAVNYLRLKPGADTTMLNLQIATIVKDNYTKEMRQEKITVVPFRYIIHESGKLTETIVKSAIAASLFLLIVMIVNLINLNSAGYYLRVKEVAVRRMMGGSRLHTFTQFCFENALIVAGALLIGWSIFSLALLRLFNGLLGDRFGTINLQGGARQPFIFAFGILGLLIILLAAALPARKLNTIPVMDAVKGRFVAGNYARQSTIRMIFMTVQFVPAIVLICCALVFSRQVSFMKSFSLGFNKENLVVVKLNLSYLDPKSAGARFTSILNTLRNDPRIRGFSTSASIPTGYEEDYNSFYDPSTGKKVMLRYTDVDAGYFPTYQIAFIQGRNFDDALASSERSSVIINESAIKALGWKDAIGKQLKEDGSTAIYTVVGVTKDFHFDGPQNAVQPLMHGYAGLPSLGNKYLTLRVLHGKVKEVTQEIASLFKSMPSRRPFSYELMNDRIDMQYTVFNGILKATNYVAALTVMIACMGLFGLISLIGRQRTKEIGIRKVLGASLTRLLTLICGGFLFSVFLAILIGVPVAWLIMKSWLQNFAYRATMTGGIFMLGVFVLLIAAFSTLAMQTIRIAISNPVTALKDE